MSAYKKYSCLILLLIFLTNVSFSQERCGVVIDASTKQPVPYATLYFPGTWMGMYASDHGNFCLLITGITSDSLIISALGYTPLKLDLKSFSLSDTLVLRPDPILLREVVVKSDRRALHSKMIGYFKKPLFELRTFGFSHNSNATLATYIPNNGNSDAAINKVYCRTTPRKNDLVKAFRVALRLYTNSPSTQLPGKDLISELIVAEVGPEQKAIVFDIAKYGIKLPPDGFWIGVTCVGYTDSKGEYIPNQDRKFGKFTFKNTTKLKVATIEHIAPMYNFTIAQGGLRHKSVTAGWNGIWYPRTEKENMVFSFGAEIVW